MRQSTHTARIRLATLGAVAALVAAACGGGGGDDPGTAAPDTGTAVPDTGTGTAVPATGGSEPAPAGALQMMIASSGDAETTAVEAATAAWTEESGVPVEVIVAQDINQQLGQAFAGGNPPDLFYVDSARFADLANTGALYPYMDQLEHADDFYPSLVEAFTWEGEAVCAPKDFSTLALVINTDLWEAAGLGDDDIPTTWDELATVAATLTTGDQAGLGVGATRDRLLAFFVQNGGWLLGEDGTTVTATTPENVEALTYVQGLMKDGVLKYPTALDAGWGGEAFGIGRAAMTIEGNWIRGAMENDYPDVNYQVVELPEGPAGPGTLLFTQCWGVAAASDAHDQAVSLIEHLTSVETQIGFAEAFGVMPSRQAAREEYVAAFPEDEPFINGGEYGHGPISAAGFDRVLADFDAQLQQLATLPPEQILQSFQQNAEAALAEE